MQIVQTLDVMSIEANKITGFAFVFLDMEITHKGIEVSDVVLVRILKGRLVDGEPESICIKSFLVDCQQFTTTQLV